jgi:Sortilin, neurotensin receptor 3, C-terminal
VVSKTCQYSVATRRDHLSRKTFDFGVNLRARILTTVPDSTSQKFILVGQIAKKDQLDYNSRFAVVFLDFAPIRTRQCTDNDLETWYARKTKDSECLMGHKVSRMFFLSLILISCV